jgi:hypothetical protein
MTRRSGWIAGIAAVLLAGAANAHTLRIECKKTTDTDVVCRGLFTDGEVARNISVQLIDEDSDKVLASGKTNVQGRYAFKVPPQQYAVVIQASKSEIASMSGEDIW